MFYLILSIICSVTVGVIFKIVRRYTVNVTEIITWNYVFALLLCYIFFNPDLSVVNSSAPWFIYIPLAILLPSIFLILAASIKHMGIVRTDAAQRLSLIIPIIAAYFIFNESFNSFKLTGLIIGFPAIWLIMRKKQDNHQNKWIYPAVVLVGFGIVDILFKKIAIFTTLPYTTSLFIVFCGALAVAFLYVLYGIIIKKSKPGIINIAFGALVGIFNFGNIFFYLTAHRVFAENPSTVFAIMNIGVIVLGSFIGVSMFKENMTKMNYAGIVLAILAIIFITLSQVYT